MVLSYLKLAFSQRINFDQVDFRDSSAYELGYPSNETHLTSSIYLQMLAIGMVFSIKYI